MRTSFLFPLIITIGFTLCGISDIEEFSSVKEEVETPVDYETLLGIYAAVLSDKNKNLVESIAFAPAGKNEEEREILDNLKKRFQGVVQKVDNAKSIREMLTLAYVTPIYELLDVKGEGEKDFKIVLKNAFANGSIDLNAIDEAKELIKLYLCNFNTKEEIKELYVYLEKLNFGLTYKKDAETQNRIDEAINQITASSKTAIEQILPIIELRREASDFFGDALRFIALSTYVRENYIRDDNAELANKVTSTLIEMYAEYINAPKVSQGYRNGLVYDLEDIHDLFNNIAQNFPQRLNSLSIENAAKNFLTKQIATLKAEIEKVNLSDSMRRSQKISF